MNDEPKTANTPPDIQAEYQAFLASPEYQAAILNEGAGRELAFVDGPEKVAGVSLRPLTSRDLLILQQIGSPLISSSFVSGKRQPVDRVPDELTREFAETHIVIEPRELAAFLWVQSVEFVPLTGWHSRRRWRAFMRRARALIYGETCEAVRRYVAEAMNDRPGGSGEGGGASVASWIAGMVHLLAKEYHWTEAAILDLPIKRVFQYERCIVASRGQNAALFSLADKLRGDWLQMVNERNAKMMEETK